MSSVLDRSKEVREGESFDVGVVDEWLKKQGVELEGHPKITQYSGGASNWTYCLTYQNKELILRKPPKGTKAKSAHDMGREYRVQKALKPVFPYVPEMIAFCEDKSLIEDEFYVMEKLVGIIPRANLPKDLEYSKQDIKNLCLNVLDRLVDLHNIDYKKADLETLGKGSGYCLRQIKGWSERYRNAKTWNVPSYEKVMAWLDERIPEDIKTCVIHNDYRFDNVVLDPDNIERVIGILDWEMATLGDPLMDLGNSLAYWIQNDDNFILRKTRRQPTHLDGMLTREEVVEYYCDKANLKIDNWPFYEVYGLFRLAVILQQIYYRYHHKQTNNPAFKNFWILVNFLNYKCNKIIKRAKK